MYLNIRGKMALGLTLVLLVSLIMFGGAVVALLSYQETVRKFNQAINDSPRQEELVDALARLSLPVMQSLPPPAQGSGTPALDSAENTRFAELQRRKFLEQLSETRGFMVQFQTRINHLRDRDVRSSIFPVLESPVAKIDVGLDFLQEHAGKLSRSSPEERLVVLEEIRFAIGNMMDLAMHIPAVTQELNRELFEARRIHKWLSYVIYISGTTSLVIFLLLIRYGYISFFLPVCECRPVRGRNRGACR